jgi:hypothetical protein
MIKWLSTIKYADAGQIMIEKMVLDENGFPQPTGEYETLDADAVVLALGQEVDLSFLENVPGLEIKDGVVQVGPDLMTGRPGVFAGGDMVSSERTVTVAVGHGKKAARHIDAWLKGTRYVAPPKHELASFDKLNTWYYSDAPKTMRPMLDLLRRNPPSMKWCRDSMNRTRCSRRAAASPAATVSNATTVTASAPTMR